MKIWNTAGRRWALVTAVTTAVGFGTAVYGQAREDRVARAFELLPGGGSEIGVSIRDVDMKDASGRGAAVPPGVLVQDVTAGSPAESAGIKKGDIVVEFDGERVRSVRQFTRLVQETPPGRRVPAAVSRSGQRVTLTVEPRAGNPIRRLAEMDAARVLRDYGGGFPAPPPPPAAPPNPASPSAPPPPPPAPPAPEFPDIQSFIWRSDSGLGITVTSLSDQLAEYFGVKKGVLVTAVRDNSAAQAAGFKAGDVVTALNGQEVSNPSDLRQRTERLRDGDEFTADVMREKKVVSLKGKIERRTTRGATRTSV